MTTLDWSPEDAKLLYDHYEFILHLDEFREGGVSTNEMDAKMKDYLQKLKTDKDFALKELHQLKELMTSGREPAERTTLGGVLNRHILL
jgi:hypothetical protein